MKQNELVTILFGHPDVYPISFYQQGNLGENIFNLYNKWSQLNDFPEMKYTDELVVIGTIDEYPFGEDIALGDLLIPFEMVENYKEGDEWVLDVFTSDHRSYLGSRRCVLRPRPLDWWVIHKYPRLKEFGYPVIARPISRHKVEVPDAPSFNVSNELSYEPHADPP